MAVSGIYEIVNLVNGKRYVGSAVNLARRKADHIRRLRKQDHHSRALQSAWIKYGEEAFQFRTIVVCDRESLILEEQKAIDCKSEYNMTRAAGSCLGRVLQPETKAKIALAHKGRKLGPRTEEHRQKLSGALKGKPKSASVIEALQSARREYQFTEADKASRAEGMKRAYAEGRRPREKSEDHKRKISQGLLGYKPTDEARANQSAAQTGKKRGPYKLDPAKAEARREAGRRLAQQTNARRYGQPLQ